MKTKDLNYSTLFCTCWYPLYLFRWKSFCIRVSPTSRARRRRYCPNGRHHTFYR